MGKRNTFQQRQIQSGSIYFHISSLPITLSVKEPPRFTVSVCLLRQQRAANDATRYHLRGTRH